MNEVLNLRIKDLDFGYDRVYVWDFKSLNDRTLRLPAKLKAKTASTSGSCRANTQNGLSRWV